MLCGLLLISSPFVFWLLLNHDDFHLACNVALWVVSVALYLLFSCKVRRQRKAKERAAKPEAVDGNANVSVKRRVSVVKRQQSISNMNMEEIESEISQLELEIFGEEDNDKEKEEKQPLYRQSSEEIRKRHPSQDLEYRRFVAIGKIPALRCNTRTDSSAPKTRYRCYVHPVVPGSRPRKRTVLYRPPPPHPSQDAAQPSKIPVKMDPSKHTDTKPEKSSEELVSSVDVQQEQSIKQTTTVSTELVRNLEWKSVSSSSSSTTVTSSIHIPTAGLEDSILDDTPSAPPPTPANATRDSPDHFDVQGPIPSSYKYYPEQKRFSYEFKSPYTDTILDSEQEILIHDPLGLGISRRERELIRNLASQKHTIGKQVLHISAYGKHGRPIGEEPTVSSSKEDIAKIMTSSSEENLASLSTSTQEHMTSIDESGNEVSSYSKTEVSSNWLASL